MSKFEVGTLSFSFTDEERKEVLGNGDSFRRIPVKIYYPIDMAGRNKAAYVSERKKEAIQKAFSISRSCISGVAVNCYQDAPLMENKKFPLLLFNHGYKSYIESNTVLCTDIAANGYIVASVGHAHEAVVNEYEDGSYDYFDKKIGKLSYKKGILKVMMIQLKLMMKSLTPEEADQLFWEFQTEHTPFYMERVKEWAADTLAAFNEIKKRFGDYIDLTKGVAASGHSFGGATAYYLCQNSDEIICGANIDGAIFGDYRNKILKKPFYQFSCKQYWNTQSLVLLRKEVPVLTMVFEKMKHMGFTDLKFMTNRKAVVGKLDCGTVYHYLLQGHLHLLDKNLKGKETGMIQSQHKEVEIRMH